MKHFAGLLASVCALSLLAPLYAQLPLNPSAARQFGQARQFGVTGAPNLIEGREVWRPEGVALDTSVSPPSLYIADTVNNRVLGYRNALTAAPGALADIVIGQVDLLSTQQNGGSNSGVGLAAPVGLAVDKQGNLYIADAGNNRILRFPRPFTAQASGAERQFPDLVLGQPYFAANSPNQTLSAPTERTLSLMARSLITGQLEPLQTTLAFDAAGNLWTTDGGNSRAIRYPANALTAGNYGPPADLVLGQSTFTFSQTTTEFSKQRLDKTLMAQPAGLAIDAAGRVYVSDALARVLMYTPPFSNGQAATRLLGIALSPPAVQGQPAPPPPPFVSATSFGLRQDGAFQAVEGVFTIDNKVYVCDSTNNRILRYDSPETFPAETATNPSPTAVAVYGQSAGDFSGNRANRALSEPNASTLQYPTAAAVSATEVYLTDTANNRVLVFPISGGLMASTATRVLGQVGFAFNSPNLVEGRELNVFAGAHNVNGFNGTFADGAGVVVDSKSNPPRLYVADTGNNRVLGFKDARNVKQGDHADIVIGQSDFYRVQPNRSANGAFAPNPTGLWLPAGLAVDANGSLYIADGGNARVVRYPNPFAQTGDQKPDLVLGQPDFYNRFTDPTSRTMAAPYGVAFSTDGSLYVSDALLNRVLFFQKPANGDFSIGQAATKVFGQPDFVSFSVYRASATNFDVRNRFSGPHGIATDTDDRLYVTDTGNGRVLIFDRAPASLPDASAAATIVNLNNPHSIYISQVTGEIWVANTSQNEVNRYPKFDLQPLTTAPNSTIQAAFPIGLTLDAFGNLIVVEASNRLSFYYPSLSAANAASYTSRPLSPGVIASIFSPNGSIVRFSEQAKAAPALPLPTDLSDIQVLINGTAAPLFYVDFRQINFVVPFSTPSSGTAEFQVVRRSTGQIVATTTLPLGAYTPALFTTTGGGTGQVAALNEDNTVNAPGNGIAQGKVIQLFGTGQGFVSKAPADGTAASGPINTDALPDVFIGNDFVPPANILYSGLAPGLPGVWQINVRVPEGNLAPIGDKVNVLVRIGSTLSNDAGNGQRIQTTIAVKGK